jgi:Fur family ferric uptake transcriptional regulator
MRMSLNFKEGDKMEKIYNTKQKMQIIELLKSSQDKHLTADDMMMIFQMKKINVSRATLYRYLDVLVQTGVIKKFYLGEGEKACYQYIGTNNSCKEHFHLVCLECGKLYHLECNRISDMVNHIEDEHKFKVDPGRIIFYGICEECQKEVSQ